MWSTTSPDSVSVVDLSNPRRPFVKETLLTGDEPRDVVIGGPDFDRLFVTTAHRGQNHPLDPELTSPGVGRADVWVWNTLDPGRRSLHFDLFRGYAPSSGRIC